MSEAGDRAGDEVLSDQMLATALAGQKRGTQMAGAFVDEDGTATVHLFERVYTGWLNLTERDNDPITSNEMAAKYDDVVLTRFAEKRKKGL